MRSLIAISIAFSFVAVPAVAQEGPGDLPIRCKPPQGADIREGAVKCPPRNRGPQKKGIGSTNANTYTAVCETSNGFGRVSFSDDPDLIDQIEAALADGQTVRVTVDGTDATGLDPNGANRAIAVVNGPGGRKVICYK